MTFIPFRPEGELKQRQKSSRLKAEPLFLQAAILNNVLKVRFIILGGKYVFRSCRNTILYVGMQNDFGPPVNLLLVPVCDIK